jgi:hypothetical protein
MIEQKQNSIYALECDVCGKGIDVTFSCYDDALFYARLNNWQLLWTNGSWKNICPRCKGM